MRIATLIATVVLGAGVVSAQSLGDVARQERMRRAGLEKHARVLTNEDLSREQILPAESWESVAPLSASSPAPVVTAAPAVVENRPALPAVLAPALPVQRPAPAPVPEPTQEISLGEYARAVRAERAQRRAREQMGREPSAASAATPVAPAEERPWKTDDSGVPAWTAHEQPGFSLGEYARAQRTLRRKDVPLVLTLDAKATPARVVPAPAPKVSVVARQERKNAPARAINAPAAAKAIVVQKGDSLWKLSRTHLGEGRLWPAIWAANPTVRNPHRIHPGQSLSRPSEMQVAMVREAVSGGPAIAKLAPASAPRPVGLQLGGHHGKYAITGQADLPAGLVLSAGRVRLSGTVADPDRVRDGQSHNGAAPQPVAVKRTRLPDLPGHGGLR